MACVVEVHRLIFAHFERLEQRHEHRALRVERADEREVAHRQARALDGAAGGGDEVRQRLLVEPALHLGRVLHVEERVPVGFPRAAAGDLHLQGVRAVRDRVRAEELVARRVPHEQPRDGAVAEVEHEARPLVRVVEEVRLAASRHDQHVLQLVLGTQQVARDAQRDRRAVRDVVVLDRERVRGPDAVRDIRRRLPDRVVAPHRPVVHDHVDLLRVEPGLREQVLGRAHREVGRVLVIRGDVLAA